MEVGSPEWNKREAFWSPIARAVVADFLDLRLGPPMIDHDTDSICIFDGLGRSLAVLRRQAVTQSDQPPAHIVITVARAVQPRGLE